MKCALRGESRKKEKEEKEKEGEEGDLYPSCLQSSPCLFFIHGGYLQRNPSEGEKIEKRGKRSWRFPSPPFSLTLTQSSLNTRARVMRRKGGKREERGAFPPSPSFPRWRGCDEGRKRRKRRKKKKKRAIRYMLSHLSASHIRDKIREVVDHPYGRGGKEEKEEGGGEEGKKKGKITSFSPPLNFSRRVDTVAGANH